MKTITKLKKAIETNLNITLDFRDKFTYREIELIITTAYIEKDGEYNLFTVERETKEVFHDKFYTLKQMLNFINNKVTVQS